MNASHSNGLMFVQPRFIRTINRFSCEVYYLPTKFNKRNIRGFFVGILFWYFAYVFTGFLDSVSGIFSKLSIP